MAGLIATGSCSHMRVEPSRSVSRKVTVPDGGCTAMAPKPAELGLQEAKRNWQPRCRGQIVPTPLDAAVVAGESFVGQIHLYEIVVHLTAFVEPFYRRAVPARKLVGLLRAGFDSVALRLSQRLEQCVALGF